jgi:ribosomal protein S6
MTEGNSLYEMMAIIDPELGEEATSKQIDKIKKFITDLGGNITHEDIWGVQDLAYNIKKNERGYYVVLNFEIVGDQLAEFKSELALEQNLIRYMLLKAPKYYEFKTLEVLEKEAEEARLKKEAELEEKDQKPAQKPAPKPTPEPEVKEVVEETAPEPEVEEVVEETAPEPEVEEVVEETAPEPEVEEVVEETAPEPEVEEVVEETAPEPEPVVEEIKFSDKKELEDVDAKLKSIIDDPDISL